jgi:hypothetical protein
MKYKIRRSVEVCANLAIIVVAIAVVAVLVRSYLFPTSAVGPTQTQQRPGGPSKGTKLEVSGVDWSQSGTTLVLALQKGCHFCTESAGFYQRLAQQASGQKGVRLVAVFPQSPEEGKSYLDSLKVPIGDIRQSSLPGLGVSGTPTLILVDSKGVVKQSWVGHLPPEGETEVLRLLQTSQPG